MIDRRTSWPATGGTLLNGLVARDKVASAVELDAAPGRGVSG